MYDIFKNKHILVTGITGFVGSHLAAKLRFFGASVYGISRSLRDKNIIRGDITNYNLVDEYIRDKKIDICFHLAGESLVEAGQKDPYNVFKVNMEGILNVLESSKKNSLERIIIASTAHVYGRNKVPYFEGYTPRPSRPYETSKACTDLIAQSYADTFNLPILIPRFVNIYGPGDLNFNRLVPKTIKSVLLNQSPRMWGGEVVRDYLYIDDAVEGYLKLAAIDIGKVGNNRIFNFGTGNKITVRELVYKIMQITKSNVTIKRVKEMRVEEIKSQYVSSHKATKLLGWQAQTVLDDGLQKTIEWYKEYFNA